jgi:putative transposase
MPSRKVTFKLYPNATERAALERVTGAHCKVHNTLLETSRHRHKAGLPAYNRASVCQDVLVIRRAHPFIQEATLAQSLQVTGERLVKAFAAFFRRREAGEKAGYPRFKSAQRFSGFGFKAEGEGYRLIRRAVGQESGPGYRYSAVKLSGIGTISLKGKGRFHGKPTSAEVLRKGEDWFLSVTFDVSESAVARAPAPANTLVAFDAGITDLLTTLKYHEGEAVYDSVDNPRWLKGQLTRMAALQRDISALEELAKRQSGKAAGFPVNGQLKAAYGRLRSLHQRVRNQRHDFYHKLSAWMVGRFGHIITEELSVSGMLTQPDKGSGLKRGVADAAWASLLDKLSYKAEEAGAKFEQVPTTLIKPTRRCSCCGVEKARADMPLAQRQYVCTACGFALPRDRNACRNMVRYAFEGVWWDTEKKTRPGTDLETPPEPALAPAQVE